MDVGVHHVPVALVAEHPDAGDGAVNATVGAVGEAGFEEFLLEGAREAVGDGGLHDAVADGGDEERAMFLGTGFLFDRFLLDNDLAQGKGPVRAGTELFGEQVAGSGGPFGEVVDRDGVHAGATAVFADAGEGFQKFAGIERRAIHSQIFSHISESQ